MKEEIDIIQCIGSYNVRLDGPACPFTFGQYWQLRPARMPSRTLGRTWGYHGAFNARVAALLWPPRMSTLPLFLRVPLLAAASSSSWFLRPHHGTESTHGLTLFMFASGW